MARRYPGGFITATFKPLDPHGDANSLFSWGPSSNGQSGQNDIVNRSSPTQVGTGTLTGSSVIWSQISAGGGTSAGGTKTDGTLWTWGRNHNGQLGSNSVTDRSSPVQVGALTTWALMAVGPYFNQSAIKTDGTMWLWGFNNYGNLGTNDIIKRSSPVQVGPNPVAGTNDWSLVSGALYFHSALKTNGTMWLWGANNYGQLGDNTRISRSSPVQIGTDATWSQLSKGPRAAHVNAIKTNGTMWSWGRGDFGELGLNDIIYRSSPVQIGTLTTWSKVAAGGLYSIAVKTDGTLWSFGYNAQGTLGNNTVIHRSSPIQVGALTTWSQVTAGGRHSGAIKTDGTMWLWGRNNYGQMGQNDLNINRSSPIQVGALTTWSKIASGNNTILGLKTDGTMWAWGNNNNGQLGDNTNIDRSSPIQVGALTTWSQIAGGRTFSIAIKTDGTLWSFGYNDRGQLGDNTLTKRSSPVQVGSLTTWSQLEAGSNHAAALETDGSLYAWGMNSDGQVGDNTTIKRSSPTQVGSYIGAWARTSHGRQHTLATKVDGTLYAWGANSIGAIGDNTVVYRSSPVQVGALTTWSVISTGNFYSAAVKTDGSLWAWGHNNAGQLGQNDVINRSSPVQIGATPAAGTSWSLVSGGNYFHTAIKPDGTLWSFGYNDNGQLGLNDVSFRSSPVQIGSDATWSQLSEGSFANHVLAIKTNGTLWSFGYNVRGQLGQNDVVKRSSPVQVGALTAWSKVAAGSFHSLSTKTDGTLWSWGRNDYGHLGDNTGVDRSSPIQVGSLTTWSKVAASVAQSVAIKTDGTMWTWGRNSDGAHGRNDDIWRSSPVQIGALTTWSLVSSGGYFVAAIKTDGTMWAWGLNSSGMLGLNDVVNRSSPVQVGALTTWSKVKSGAGFNVAIKTDGTMWAFGDNGQGQIGDNNSNNTSGRRSSPVQIGALTTWSQVGVGRNHVAALETDGSLYAWGQNGNGQVGDSTIIKRSSPVSIGEYVEAWSLVTTGLYHTTATKADGTIWAWGRGNHGRLGLNDVANRSSPVQIGALTTWSTLSTGGEVHSGAIKTDGTLWMWGYNEGNLGDNTGVYRSSPVQIGTNTTWTKITLGQYNSLGIKTVIF
jgi:alpha-tubulin suppressor-like RCC1 family protein